MPKLYDCFPFFNELDVLEIRLNELAPLVEKFVIVECRETYGGDPKPLYLGDNWERFKPFHNKIVHCITDKITPRLPHTLRQNVPGVSVNEIRTIGRLRERNAREELLPFLRALQPAPDSIISFGDCDEIPRAEAIQWYKPGEITRLKQRTYYYNVNCQIDYGRDVCSRARIGAYSELERLGSLYDFRMYRGKDPQCPAIEEAGWHFSYFGGDIGKLHEKVSALNPFLSEYKLFGDGRLIQDIIERRDLHHRPTGFSELPETFERRPTDDPLLPKHFLNNLSKFQHFTLEYFQRRYA